MNLCVWCPMVFNPDLAGKRATDDRGGTFTGWFLPEGVRVVDPHEHEILQCGYTGCMNDADAGDGVYCSDYCRNQDIKERGE